MSSSERIICETNTKPTLSGFRVELDARAPVERINGGNPIANAIAFGASPDKGAAFASPLRHVGRQ